jgi:hypothetical protein
MNKKVLWDITVFFSVCLDRFSVAADISEGYKGNRKYDLLPEVKSSEDVEKGTAPVAEATTGSTPQPHDKPRELSKSKWTFSGTQSNWTFNNSESDYY